MNRRGRLKKKTILWILGWICFFPLPVTIILLRKKNLKAFVKYGVIAVAWLIYLPIVMSGKTTQTDDACVSVQEKTTQTDDTRVSVQEKTSRTTHTETNTEEEPAQINDLRQEAQEKSLAGVEEKNNIQEISLTETEDLTLKQGEKYTSGTAKIKVKKVSEFAPDDVTFVSDNPEVARIEFAKATLPTELRYEITAVGTGDTTVYVQSNDGSIVSEKVKISVLEPVLVESIFLEGARDEINVGESFKVTANVLPENAEDKSILWCSSDEEVVSIDPEGTVTAKSAGSATITASSTSGATSSFSVRVSGSKKQMNLKVTHSREDDYNIGEDWSYTTGVNGEPVSRQYLLSAGDTIECHAQFIEEDSIPDVGDASASHFVTEEDLQNGFSVVMDLYVTENRGRNSGKSAHFIVTYNFTV